MKKIEIHVFPNKTCSVKSYKFTPLKAVFFLLCIVAAVAGFLLFSPRDILDNVTNNDLSEMHRQNVTVKNEIKEIRASVDANIMKAEETKILKDSTMKHGGFGFTLENSFTEDEQVQKSRKTLTELERTFRMLADTLEKDSALAAKIPVLHPMKNAHVVRNRFGMTYDPFTERELPHRGIDYVAAEGDTVYATGAGVVSAARKHRGFGLTLKIEHTKAVKTFYAHLSQILVNNGSKVQRGQPVAIVGESGRGSSIGLHYEVRIDGNPVNPERFFITK